MGKCNSPLKQPVRNTWPLVYAVSSHTDRVGRPSARGPVHRLSSAEWSDTRRRIGASFTRTSQAFARFNPEIRTGAAELAEHSARRPRPRVRRVVVNLSPHRTWSRSRSPANRRTPARHRGCGDSWLPLQRPCIRGLALLTRPHSTRHIPQAERKRDIWVGRPSNHLMR